MTQKILKGKISNCIYIWHSNECACEKCQNLDNSIYYSINDIPDLPHPNCKCYIEVVKDINNYKNTEIKHNSENNSIIQLEELIADAQVLQNQIQEEIRIFKNLLNITNINPYVNTLIENCIDALEQIWGTVNDFINNYNDMKDANTIGADKYFHSKANCEAAQRGEVAEMIAKGISDLREFTDLFKNVLIKGMTIKESLEDSAGDQEANKYGRAQGRTNPNKASKILVDIYRPNGLPDKY